MIEINVRSILFGASVYAGETYVCRRVREFVDELSSEVIPKFYAKVSLPCSLLE